jgi:hypothetical protein
MLPNILSTGFAAASLALVTMAASAADPSSGSSPSKAIAFESSDGVLDTSSMGYMRIKHDPAFDLTDDFTFEVRVSFVHFDGHQEILSKASGWDQDGFVFKWRENRLEFIRGGRGGKISTGANSGHTIAAVELAGLETNRMYEFAVTKRGSDVTFFLDGKPVGRDRVDPLIATTADLQISTPWAKGNLAGQVDELRIWRYARSAEEMTASFGKRYEDGEANMVALHRFDAEDARRAASQPVQDKRLFGNAEYVSPIIIPATQHVR